MKKRTAVAPIMVFLIGAGIFLYPFAANQIALYRQSKEITVYETAVSAADRAELEQQREEAEKYNDNLSGDPVHDPFVLNSGYVLPENYLNVLNLSGDGVMCYIEIPKISVNLPVYHGTDEEVLQKGVGHLQGTSLPVGGKGSHSVLSAHSGLPDKLMFTNLDQLQNGDVFYIDVLGEVLAYEVDQIKKVLPNETDDLMINAEEDYVTLVTCTPYGVNTHRLLVRGTRIPYEEAKKIENEETEKTGQAWRREYTHAGIIAGILFVVIFTVYYILKRRNKGSAGKRKRERVKIYQKKKMNSRKH